MPDANAINDTIRKFGYPGSLIAEYRHWLVLLRPQQATLGALVLACLGPATAFGAIPAGAHAELAEVTRALEGTLARAFQYEKINYLMLMMVDREVHFHVLPRYGSPRSFDGQSFADRGWPKLPDLAAAPEVPPQRFDRLRDRLRELWPAPARA
jgi:diadenosine tetraphosphate (Ap4A) HIT family hydrolase